MRSIAFSGAVTVVCLTFLVACSSATGGDGPSPQTGQAESALRLSAAGLAGVQSECKGPYASERSCTKCVKEAANSLVTQQTIPAREKSDLIESFEDACEARCIATTCALEGATCGSIPDGCGGTLACGAPCAQATPHLEHCVCVDGAVITTCAQLDCFSSAEQDAICVPACAAHGGLSATGCLPDEPICAAP